MAEVAAELGVHYDTLRKSWRELCASEDFPRPFLRRKWDADQIAACKDQRSRRDLRRADAEALFPASRPLKPRGGFAALRGA